MLVSLKCLELLLILISLKWNWIDCGRIPTSSQSAGCIINLQNDIPESEPLYITQNHGQFELLKPQNKLINIATNRNLTLYCAGKTNTLQNHNTNQLTLHCNNNHHFQNGQNVRNLSCVKTPASELRVGREYCAKNHGFLLSIGFNLSTFMSIMTICYDNQTEKSYYNVHHINGAAIKYSVKENKRKDFKTTGMSQTTANKVRRIYQRQNQIKRFQSLFGINQPYINSTSFLARGHLTPDADFIFPSAQLATYYYVNVAPEFQIVNAGNWKRVENIARELAHHYQSDFEIYTGTYGILKLPNHQRQLIPVYLDDNNQLEIPQWFWKIIKNSKTQTAIVLITLNNPFAHHSEIIEFCPNVCATASLNSIHFRNIRKGYTFCCDVNSFIKVINYLPSNLVSHGLLSFGGLQFD